MNVDTEVELSVIIPVLNGADDLDRQLLALQHQRTARQFEVIIVDGGSTDRTIEVAQSWLSRGNCGFVINSSRGIALQRNTGVLSSNSDLIAHCDCDDIVAETWVDGMCETLNKWDIVTGPTYIVADIETFTLSPDVVDPFEDSAVGPKKLLAGYLPFALGGNIGYHRSLWRHLGGFDHYLDGAEDIDFVWRGLEDGFTLGFDERVVLRKSMRSRPSDRFRQHYKYGRVMPRLYLRHRGSGMPRFEPNVVRDYVSLVGTLPRMVLSRRYRSNWMRRAGARAGRLIGSITSKTFVP